MPHWVAQHAECTVTDSTADTDTDTPTGCVCVCVAPARPFINRLARSTIELKINFSCNRLLQFGIMFAEQTVESCGKKNQVPSYAYPAIS